MPQTEPPTQPWYLALAFIGLGFIAGAALTRLSLLPNKPTVGELLSKAWFFRAEARTLEAEPSTEGEAKDLRRLAAELERQACELPDWPRPLILGRIKLDMETGEIWEIVGGEWQPLHEAEESSSVRESVNDDH